MEDGEGEIEMTQANSDLLQKLLSELAQQIALLIEARNEKKEILEEDFDSGNNGI